MNLSLTYAYKEIKILHKKKIKTYTKKNEKLAYNLSLLSRPLYAMKNPVFIGKTQRGRAYEDGGANAPPTDLTKPRTNGFCCVSATMVRPGGHNRGGTPPGFVF